MQQSQLELISSLCNSLGSINDDERREAEARLLSFSNSDGFLLTLMEVTRTSSVNFGSRLQAAIYFKNSVTKRWCLNCNETDPDNNTIIIAVPVNEQEKCQIRSTIIQLLVNSEDLIAKQFVESLVQIGLEEYYIKWPTMMKELVAACQSNNISVINRVLSIVEGICKVLETVPDYEIIGNVVLHFIDDLNIFLSETWQQMTSLLSQYQNDYDKLELLLTNLVLIANTRRYWIGVDVIRNINTDEEEENATYINLDVWMKYFIDIIQYENPMMTENTAATVVEDLKSSIISFCTICVNHHTDLFVPYFDAFSNTIWNILSSVSKGEGSLKYQDVAVSSLHFFSAICTKPLFRSVFENSDMIEKLISYVIIPNCMMTVDVMDSFESQPHLYIKNYEEGYKMSSQRYAVAHLIASLRSRYNQIFINPLMNSIMSLISGSPEQRDCAYHLFFYRCFEFPTIMKPIRQCEDIASVQSFINTIVLNDLKSNSPILICDALISICIFLTFVDDSLLTSIILQCIQLIQNQYESVRVTSVIVIERVLTQCQIARPKAINIQDIVSQTVPLTEYLLNITLPLKQTDHYLMKAYLRIVLFLNKDILPYSQGMLEKLANNLSYLSSKITNPHYVHYLFEALVAFVRISSVDQELCGQIENYLMPYMQDYLSRNILEYMPYIFQLFGLMLHSRNTISPQFLDLLNTIMNEQVWKEKSCQTALVFLLSMYLTKDYTLFLTNNRIQQLFTLFRLLCSIRSSRIDGIKLLQAIITNIPFKEIEHYLSVVMEILVIISGKGASRPLKESILHCLAFITIRQSVQYSSSLIAAKNAQSFANFFYSLFLNGVEDENLITRKVIIVGTCKMLLEEPAFYCNSALPLAEGVVMLIHALNHDINRDSSKLVVSSNFLQTNVEYDSYHKLSLAQVAVTDPIPQITDVNQVITDTINGIAQKLGGSLDTILSALSESEREYLKKKLFQ